MSIKPDSPLLSMRRIDKSFPGVHAVDGVDLSLRAGEVLALLGENGAGKTTLMNILNGVVVPDSGEIWVRGRQVRFSGPLDAQGAGIGYIHQELNVIHELSVQENLFLTREPRNAFGLLDYKTMRARCKHHLSLLDIDVDPEEKAGNLPIVLRQMVEITKALLADADIIVMDEPTSSLTDGEIDQLFIRIRRLRDGGKGIIYISHRLEEIFQITDTVMVMRNGRYVGTVKTEDTDRDELVRMMAGTEVERRFFTRESRTGSEILRLNEVSGPGIVRDVSLSVRRGEIVGIAGLVGSGRTELLETIFGVLQKRTGTVTLDGTPLSVRNTNQAIRKGIAYIPEDRSAKSLFLHFSVLRNALVSRVEKNHITVRENDFVPEVRELAETLNIATPSLNQILRNLSGGNRQKVIIARWMLAGMKVLLVNEPTRGIDVETKGQIYGLLYDLNARGIGIILVSSELPEILTVSDRIVVMCEGRVSGEFTRTEATKEKLLTAMTSRTSAGFTEDLHAH